MRILFITHRIPYPPDKGDKIRSYNILRYLVQNNDVYLAFMIDDAKDFQYLAVLSSMVKKLCFDTVSPFSGKLLSSAAFLRRKPISVSYFYSRKIQTWVDDLLDSSGIDAVLCSSSPTAEYVFRSRYYESNLRQLPCMIDLIDVDSYKWEQYAERTRGLMRGVYNLEARYLRKYEERIGAEFNRVFLSTETEQALFLKRVAAANTQAIVNGVDAEYYLNSFQPAIAKEDGPVLAFVGAMDYFPNVDGVQWFVQDVYPSIQQVYPNITFYIVGNRPSPAVRRLAEKHHGVKVTGYVEDVRIYLAAADVCVVPLHIARGIQNKVLEAMAMGKALVCTPQALDGIHAETGKEVLIASDADAFAGAVIQLLGDKNIVRELGTRARAFVQDHFSWKNNLALLNTIFHNQPKQATGELSQRLIESSI
jgi:polysaccharide biosynthesis protein PslH